MKLWHHCGDTYDVEVGADKSFALGVVHEAEGAWTLWLGSFYLYIARP